MKKLENFFILLFTTIICLFLAEFGLRVFEKQNHSVYPKGLFLEDKLNGYKLSNDFKGKHIFQDFSYLVETNKYGCFERDLKKKDVEILILGDSHTWGYVNMEDRYSNILSNKYGFNTYNCALTGSGSLIQKNIYLKLLENGFHPKLIIIGYTPFNDIEDDALFPEYSVWNGILYKNRDFQIVNGKANFKEIKKLPISLSRKIKSLLHRNSSIYRFSYLLKNKLRNISQNKIKSPFVDMSGKRIIYNFNEQNKIFFDQNIDNIETVKKIAAKNKAKLLIATTPTNFKYCSESYKKSLTYIFEKFKSKSIDKVSNKFCLSDKFFYPINGHLNNKGHKYMAEKISDYLST